MHTDVKRFYGSLGVDPGASDKAIRAAFRRRAKQLHPDAPSGDASAFIFLKRAYDVLSDPNQRADYDRACRPASAEIQHRWNVPPPLPPLPTARKPRRRNGMGFARYVIAFIVMAALSLGGIHAMISLTESPPSIRTRESAAPGAAPKPDPATSSSTDEPTAAPGSSKSGFWDPTAGRKE